jgi:hypothetical protein
MRGAYVRLDPGRGIRGVCFDDLSQLTINHNGAEVLLTRETEVGFNGQVIRARYRIYSGTPDRIPPPAFRRIGPSGVVVVERVIGHTHPFPIPFSPNWNHPSSADLQYLQRIRADWKYVYGAQTEPFGRIFGLPGDRVVLYGLR